MVTTTRFRLFFLGFDEDATSMPSKSDSRPGETIVENLGAENCQLEVFVTDPWDERCNVPTVLVDFFWVK